MAYTTGTHGVAADVSRNQQALSGLARGSRIAFLVIAVVFTICVALQVFIAGMAVFAGPQNWAMHVQFVHVFELLPILMLVLSFTGRIPVRMRVESGVLFLLIGYMYFAANIVRVMPMLAATHPVMGFAIFALAVSILPRAWRLAFPQTRAI